MNTYALRIYANEKVSEDRVRTRKIGAIYRLPYQDAVYLAATLNKNDGYHAEVCCQVAMVGLVSIENLATLREIVREHHQQYRVDDGQISLEKRVI